MNDKNEKPVVYSCSGCSSTAQIANHIALKLNKNNIAKMSCVAGIGGKVKPLVEQAKKAEVIIGIDGCPLKCVEHCLGQIDLVADRHYILSEFGISKKLNEGFSESEAEKVYKVVERQILDF